VLVDIPDSVSRAQLRANQSGFELSSEPEVGLLVSCLVHR
jgi:hypothetical protein